VETEAQRTRVKVRKPWSTGFIMLGRSGTWLVRGDPGGDAALAVCCGRLLCAIVQRPMSKVVRQAARRGRDGERARWRGRVRRARSKITLHDDGSGRFENKGKPHLSCLHRPAVFPAHALALPFRSLKEQRSPRLAAGHAAPPLGACLPSYTSRQRHAGACIRGLMGVSGTRSLLSHLRQLAPFRPLY